MAKNQKRCFVVMGFGIKTDFATGRKLDLNKSYRLLIKPVVESKGLVCIRADEIQHAGLIDSPMYRELMMADVVVADLSTANVNAFYELGVRHALRPRTTIVVSEDKMAYPFDVNHISITSYTHLGNAIDFDEVERFRKVLGDKLDAVLKVEEPDSPVYTYLDLIPPALQEQIKKAKRKIREDPAEIATNSNNETLSQIAEKAEELLSQNNFKAAKKLFNEAVQLGRSNNEDNRVVADAYLVQRLALATYKAGQPDPVFALNDGLRLLGELDLAHTNDPETVALAGAIEKRLYEANQGESHLSAAILYYQRGYYLLNNRYNGINLAFMLDYRAQSSLCTDKDERIADIVNARRTRREVLVMCDRDWKMLKARQDKLKESLRGKQHLNTLEEAANREQMFWVLINRAEAYFGLDNMAGYKKALVEAKKLEHEDWMMESLKEQIKKLQKMKRMHQKIIAG